MYNKLFEILGNDENKDVKRYFKSEGSEKFDSMNNFDGETDKIKKLEPVKLCIEIELLFRYLDYEYEKKSEEKKRFFFSAIEENFYNLKKIPFIDDTKKTSSFLL